MVGPVADTRDIVGYGRQPAGHEIPERLAAGIDVPAVPVHEVHRDIQHVVDVTLKPKTRLEDEGQGTATVRVGIGPDVAAIAEEPGWPSFDKRRVRKQSHGDGLQRQTYPELFDHVRFGLVVEVGLDGAGAQHHVEAEPAFLRHVVAHDPVTGLGHERDLVAPPERRETEPEHAEPELVANFAHLAQVLVQLVAGLVHGLQRRSAQLELPARLKRDRTSGIVGEGNGIAVFDDRLPAEAGHLAQNGGDPVGSIIRHSAQIRATKDELLVLGTDPPRRGRLAAGFEIFEELPLVGDRRSRRTRHRRHARRISSDNVAAARLSNRLIDQQASAINGYGCGANHRRLPGARQLPREQRFRRAIPSGQARHG